MAEPLHRTQILLRREQHEELSSLAARRGVSVSELIRNLVDEELTHEERQARERVERRLRALDEIDKHREKILARRGGKPIEIDLAELIDESREERDDELVSQLAADRD